MPTGTPDVPINVARAKDIKEQISQHEVIGHAGLNDYDAEIDDDDSDFDEEKQIK